MRLRSAVVFTCVLLSGCMGDKVNPIGPTPTYVDVFTPGLVFSPSFLTISVGTIVRFNISGSPEGHDVTFQAVTGAPASIPVTITDVIHREFTTKGTFPYDCRTHPGMSGSVTVQ